MLHFCSGVIPGHGSASQALPEGLCSAVPLSQMNHLCWGLLCGQGEGDVSRAQAVLPCQWEQWVVTEQRGCALAHVCCCVSTLVWLIVVLLCVPG